MKHNFILFAGDYDYNRILYKDVIGRTDIQYNDGVGAPRSALRLFHKIHTSPKANRLLFDFPGKEKWYTRYWNGRFADDKPLCFVFHASYLLTRYRFTDYLAFLKIKYPQARTVLFYEDLVKSFDKSIWPDSIRENFDLLVSYDKSEAERFGILYYPTTASRVEVPADSSIPHSDVYLLAFAKDRLPKYLAIFDKLTAGGISCDFNILGVPKSVRTDNGIHYLDKPLSYFENLKHIASTKCILDIRQRGSAGFTLRLWEAVLYDKKLLTDNDSILDSEFFDPRYISLISEGIPDIPFIKSDDVFINPMKDKVSPIRFFEYLDSILKP